MMTAKHKRGEANFKKTTLYLREDQLERMNKIQIKVGIPTSEQIRHAIDSYLAQEEAK